jgi:peroxiredoxin
LQQGTASQRDGNRRESGNNNRQLGIGDQAPILDLPDLNGEIVSLESLRGSETLVLFWNPQCMFCRQMIGALKAWERNPPERAPTLLVVSTGPFEVNRAMNLRSPVILQSGFTAASSFGANSTPSAVLVDAEGKIASEIVVGASEVLKLAGAPTLAAVSPFERV